MSSQAKITLLAAFLLAPVVAAARTITIDEALESTRNNNITWRSLKEFLVQADAGRDMGIGMFLPKLKTEGQWTHMGERHEPNLGNFSQIGDLMGLLTEVVITEHPGQIARFEPFIPTGEDGTEEEGDTFGSFVPPKDTVSATFSLIVPFLNPTSIPFLQAAYDRYDAAVQRVGYGREQLLYAVGKAYFNLVALQSMIAVAERQIQAAREHYRSNKVRARLQVATQLEVKRSELLLAEAQSRKAQIVAGIEKAKASFRYFTGIDGEFEVVDPGLALSAGEHPLEYWLESARRDRKDLIATKIDALVAEHEVDKVWMKYLPSVNLMGQVKADNAQEQRFDDDPYSWVVLGTVSLDIWDGGIREAELKMNKSFWRKAQLDAEDLELKIVSSVTAARKAVDNASVVRNLAERQCDVARATQALIKASEEAGAVTNLEVIDANTQLFGAEAQLLRTRLDESIAILDLLMASGGELPF